MNDNRVYLDVSDHEAYERVLISHPIGSNVATVYCPPIGGEKPWTRTLATVAEAEAYAIGLTAQSGQAIIPYTRDKLKWWLPERFW
ncbi:hypothetical protein GHK03_01175 [Sinorhizobium medicae]|uniref:hypothetical protein n=1 Tax=Sinorhizobium medicae TaxID=110321 RepID=UPI001296B1D0|nr:hypothetical protein [Sinorhizobium medicae]MQX94869.1 hypothetical protein [Sinorhizobium medicae]